MKGVDPELMCHRLNINSRVPTRRQKRRPLDPKRAQALKDEVDKLIRVGFIREVKYSAWVSNSVLVPVPQIDQMVDATAGYELLSFIKFPCSLGTRNTLPSLPFAEFIAIKSCPSI